MTFRAFLFLFKDCDHPWGDLARDAARDKRWKENGPLSLSLLIQDRAVQIVCRDVNAAYLLFAQPIGLDLDSTRQLAHASNADSLVNGESSNPHSSDG